MSALHDIKAYAYSVSIRAGWVKRAVEDLLNQPPYETQAEDELATAEQNLAAALTAVRYARKTFRAKPVEPTTIHAEAAE